MNRKCGRCLNTGKEFVQVIKYCKTCGGYGTKTMDMGLCKECGGLGRWSSMEHVKCSSCTCSKSKY